MVGSLSSGVLRIKHLQEAIHTPIKASKSSWHFVYRLLFLETATNTIIRTMRFSIGLLALLGVATAADLPLLKLPWGKYEGEVSTVDEEVR